MSLLDAPPTAADDGGAPQARFGQVDLRQVSLTFSRAGQDLEVIRDLSLSIQRGEFVCVVGPSGCGKTTLLRLVDGLLAPTRGEVLIAGQPVRGPGRDRGFVFQSDRLLPWRDVLDNIGFSLQARGVSRKEARERARALVQTTGLEGFEHHYPHEISGGMRQRVNLARALAADPEILLMDEPFAALDAQTREVMQLELMTLQATYRKTVLFVTHQLDEAVYLGDRVVVLDSKPGRLRDIVPVTLPRPRTLDLKRTPAFGALVERIWESIKDQVLQARRI